jgi:hypothetical protein
MTIKMNDSHIISLAQIKEFLKLNNSIQFKATDRNEKYQWIEKILFLINSGC